MTVPNDPTPREYSISELEEATGVNRRTIHYYIARGLLPPSYGSGLAARYQDSHRLRLLLVEVLKRANLRLEGIREILDAMSPEDMGRLAEFADQHPSAGPEALRAWAVQLNVPLLLADQQSLTMLASPVDDAMRGSRFVQRMQTQHYRRVAGLDRDLEDADTWRRLRLLPDLEIHYRPHGDSRFAAKLRDLVEFVMRTFGMEGERTELPGFDERGGGKERK